MPRDGVVEVFPQCAVPASRRARLLAGKPALAHQGGRPAAGRPRPFLKLLAFLAVGAAVALNLVPNPPASDAPRLGRSGPIALPAAGDAGDRALAEFPDASDAALALAARGLRRQLDFLPPRERARLALDSISQWNDAELAAQPADLKARLVTAMSQGGFNAGEVKARNRLYRAAGLDPAYAAWVGNKQKALAEALAGDHLVIGAFAGWKGWDAERKRALLEHVHQRQAALFDYDAATVRQMSPKPLSGLFGGGGVELGRYGAGVIEVDLGLRQLRDDCGQALATVLHEGAHAFQDALGKKLAAGELERDGPLWRQARLFQANWAVAGLLPEKGGDRDAYAEPESDYPAYAAQPLERDAFATGDKIAGDLAARLKQKKPRPQSQIHRLRLS